MVMGVNNMKSKGSCVAVMKLKETVDLIKILNVLTLLLIVLGCSNQENFKADSFNEDDMCVIQLAGGNKKNLLWHDPC